MYSIHCKGNYVYSSSSNGVGQKRERKNAATKGHLHSSSAGGMLMLTSSMSKKPKMLRAVAAHIFS